MNPSSGKNVPKRTNSESGTMYYTAESLLFSPILCPCLPSRPPHPNPFMSAAAPSAAPNVAGGAKSKKQQELEQVPQADIRHVDLLAADREVAVEAARAAYLARSKGELPHWTDVAQRIKTRMDDKAGGTWHCITGTHFGSFVSYEVRSSAYFFVGQMGVLLFRHG